MLKFTYLSFFSMNLISSMRFYFPVGDQSVLMQMEWAYLGLIMRSFQLKSLTPP